MQNSKQYSLNALRVFTTVADRGSILLAAGDLSVTPSAVSHQIKSLETQLGIPLFVRRNNAINLTQAGQHLHATTSSVLADLERTISALQRDENEVTIHLGVSLAVRWLIPAFEKLKERHPELKIRVDTTHTSASSSVDGSNLAIFYVRAGQEISDAQLLYSDASRPVISPALLERFGYIGPGDLAKLPAIGSTADNWDWQLWARKTGVSMKDIEFTDHFDSDDAAIHAAVAGLGMALVPPILTQKEIQSGSLVNISGFQPVILGGYYLRTDRYENKASRNVLRWLKQESGRAREGEIILRR